MEDNEVKQLIERILDYTINEGGKEYQPIAIVGPKGTKDEHLRIYAFGGCIMHLSIRGLSPVFCDKEYHKYINNDDPYLNGKYPEGFYIKDDNNATRKITYSEKLELFCKEAASERKKILKNELYIYLDLAVTAAKYRMIREDKSKKGEDDSSNERRIQTQIVRYGVKRTEKWCVVDMEYNPPKNYLVGEGKKPDIIVYDFDRNQFGILELKYDNESCDNLRDHYEKFMHYYQEPQKFVKEMKRRAKLLFSDTTFDDNKKSERIANADKDKVWFGFLFVRGSKEETKNTLDKYLLRKGKKDEYQIDDVCRDCRIFLCDESIIETEKLSLYYEGMQPLKDWYEVLA